VKRMSGKEWKKSQEKDIEGDIKRYEEKHNEEVKRANGNTLWIRQLKESLKETKD